MFLFAFCALSKMELVCYAFEVSWLPFSFLCRSPILCPSLDIGLPLWCPQVVWCHWGEIESSSGPDGKMWSARETSLETLRHGQQLNQGHWENGQWDTFILPLSMADFYLPSLISQLNVLNSSRMLWSCDSMPRNLTLWGSVSGVYVGEHSSKHEVRRGTLWKEIK